jgi:hypothetical protein
MLVAFAGVAQAKPPTPKVTGTYTYFVFDDPGNWRTWSIDAQGTDTVKGTWSSTALGVYHAGGPVTCLRVVGADAWLAGPITYASEEVTAAAVAFWIHDGGTPGRKGDMAWGWYADPDEGLAEMEAICQDSQAAFEGFTPFQVVDGNAKVH